MYATPGFVAGGCVTGCVTGGTVGAEDGSEFADEPVGGADCICGGCVGCPSPSLMAKLTTTTRTANKIKIKNRSVVAFKTAPLFRKEDRWYNFAHCEDGQSHHKYICVGLRNSVEQENCAIVGIFRDDIKCGFVRGLFFGVVVVMLETP